MPGKRFCNGVHAVDGEYLAVPEPLEALGRALRDRASFRLGARHASRHEVARVDYTEAEDLSRAGWGVVFAEGSNPDVREALAPLLDLRREQATRALGSLYREFSGGSAYRPHQSAEEFLRQHSQADGDGMTDPSRIPYYLLLVGSPDEIQLDFQYEMTISNALGRLHFETTAEYDNYAQTVVAAERRRQARRATVFAVSNGEEENSRLMHDYLAKEILGQLAAASWGWTLEAVLGPEATLQRLEAALSQPPSLLVTISHGLCFPKAHPRRRAEQGAIVCSDWPGAGPVKEGTYLRAADVGSATDLGGMLLFQFACFSAATPADDAFAGLGGLTGFDPPDRAFLAALPQRLLGLPGERGARAVIGHVDRIWRYSFFDEAQDAARDRVFSQLLLRLVEGGRVGHAMRYLSQWFATYAVRLSGLLGRSRKGEAGDLEHLARTWLIANDARNYVILGDPAVRLRLG